MNKRLSLDEIEASQWYEKHTNDLKKHHLNPTDEQSFNKLEKKNWNIENKACKRCNNKLSIGYTRYCIECTKRYSDHTS